MSPGQKYRVISNARRELSGDFDFSKNCDVTIRRPRRRTKRAIMFILRVLLQVREPWFLPLYRGEIMSYNQILPTSPKFYPSYIQTRVTSAAF